MVIDLNWILWFNLHIKIPRVQSFLGNFHFNPDYAMGLRNESWNANKTGVYKTKV
jgi:hypothetical protein